jgi:hypothetical protein
MYRHKLRLTLLQAVFAIVMGVSDGRAAALSQLSNKTYTLVLNNYTFKGKILHHRFYIDSTGRIFQYANDPEADPCPSAGSFTKLNASNRGQASCSNLPGFGAVVINYTAWATLSGPIITYEVGMDRQSTLVPSLPHLTLHYVFSTDGAQCVAGPLLINNESFAPVSCEVRTGRPSR